MLNKWAPKGSDGKRAFNLTSPDFAPVDPDAAAQIIGNIPFYMSTLDDALAKDASFFKVKALAQRHTYTPSTSAILFSLNFLLLD